MAGVEGETGKETNKGTRAGKFGGSEGRKKEGLEEEDVQTVLPCSPSPLTAEPR